MAFFSKTLPERKWLGATTSIALSLKEFQSGWLDIFQKITETHKFVLRAPLTLIARKYLSLIQLGSVSATIVENRYLKNERDVTFFVEATYIALTGNLPKQFHEDIALLPFTLTGNIKDSITSWAPLMANEIGQDPRAPGLFDEIRKAGLLTVINSKITTCEECGDRKSANAIRRQL